MHPVLCGGGEGSFAQLRKVTAPFGALQAAEPFGGSAGISWPWVDPLSPCQWPVFCPISCPSPDTLTTLKGSPGDETAVLPPPPPPHSVTLSQSLHHLLFLSCEKLDPSGEALGCCALRSS